MSATEYFDSSGSPATGSQGASATMRAEFDLIQTGFGKLPDLAANGNKAVIVNAGGTALTVTVGALALAAAFTLSGAFATTLTVTAITNVTLPTTGTLATLAGAETLTNKTITTFGGALTFNPANLSATLSPTGTGTVTINPTTAGTMNNMAIGGSTPLAGVFTTLSASSTLLVTGNVTLSSLTTTRVPYASTGGLLIDASTFTFTTTGAILTVGAINVAGTTAPTVGLYNPSGTLLRTPNSLTVDDGITVSGTGTQSIAGTNVRPNQPAFFAYNSVTDVDQTGNGATPTVDFDTEVFDRGSNFSGDTFTAPVTGIYRFSAGVTITGITGTPTQFFIRLITSNRNITKEELIGTFAGVTEKSMSISALIDMDAADTCTVQVQVNGMAGDTADIYGEVSTNQYTYFCGELVA